MSLLYDCLADTKANVATIIIAPFFLMHSFTYISPIAKLLPHQSFILFNIFQKASIYTECLFQWASGNMKASRCMGFGRDVVLR